MCIYRRNGTRESKYGWRSWKGKSPGKWIRSSHGKAWNGLRTAIMSGLNKTMISEMYKNMEKSKNKIMENKDPHGKIKC